MRPKTQRPAAVAENYKSFADLEAACVEGTDYDVHVAKVAASRVAIIAPHGGLIEPGTSQIARRIAGGDLSLYVLEGKMSGSYKALHLTSHCFDDVRCLDLQADCDYSISIHGCSGDEEEVLVGGLDEELKLKLVSAISGVGIRAYVDEHRFPARNARNIVNRNRRRMGAQLEITAAARKSAHIDVVADAVRNLALSLR
jgi:phage replication-related protein YjqB (UPF0714/DUF867 family)